MQGRDEIQGLLQGLSNDDQDEVMVQTDEVMAQGLDGNGQKDLGNGAMAQMTSKGLEYSCPTCGNFKVLSEFSQRQDIITRRLLRDPLEMGPMGQHAKIRCDVCLQALRRAEGPKGELQRIMQAAGTSLPVYVPMECKLNSSRCSLDGNGKCRNWLAKVQFSQLGESVEVMGPVCSNSKKAAEVIAAEQALLKHYSS